MDGDAERRRATAELEELRALRAELMNSREAQRKQEEQLRRREAAQVEAARALQQQTELQRRAQASLQQQAEQTQRAQQEVARLAEEAQAKVAREKERVAREKEHVVQQQRAWQEGVSSAGAQLVAKMQALQRDVATRCEVIEKNARDDVRRTSGLGGTPTPPR